MHCFVRYKNMLYTLLKENSAHFKAFIALQYSKKSSVVIKGCPEV